MVAEGKIINFIVREMTVPLNGIPYPETEMVGSGDGFFRKRLKRNNGSISLNVSGKKEFNLWLTDNGTITEGDVKYKVLAVMSDGSILEKDVVRAEKGEEVSKAGMPSGTAQVSDKIRATYRGKGPMNYLKKAEVSSLLASADANPDAHLLLKLINIKGTIKALPLRQKTAKVERGIPFRKRHMEYSSYSRGIRRGLIRYGRVFQYGGRRRHGAPLAG